MNQNSRTNRMPTERVIEKLDAFLNQNNYSDAERLLCYWYEETGKTGDFRGKLTVLNEQIGLYRKLGREAECLRAIAEVLQLSEDLGMGRSVGYGTTLLNAATGYKAFGRPEEALSLYRRAQIIYEKELSPDDKRLAGLKNNMALALTDLGSYREAEKLYWEAIKILEKHPRGKLDMAISYLNLADLVNAEIGAIDGADTIERYLDRAEELLNAEDVPRDGYCAFVCEKCASVFGYYGYFLTEKELKERARIIYERS